jgi:N utilization substance protein B
LNRRTAREKTLQVLYQYDIGNTDIKQAKEFVLEGKKTDNFFERLVHGTIEHLQEIDEIIKANLEKWSFDRIAYVDRAIIRLAVYEWKYEKDIPISVTINEAVELAKKFGTEDSGRFVNGVLSKIMEEENDDSTNH